MPAARADRQTIASKPCKLFSSTPDWLVIEHVAVQTAVLTNDHKAMTALIEQLMYELHTEAKKAASSAQQEPIGRVPQATASHACPPSSNTASPPQLPFAVVDEVSSSSPAEEAGMLVGDQLVSFAHITKQTPDTLPAVAAALQVCETAASGTQYCLMEAPSFVCVHAAKQL